MIKTRTCHTPDPVRQARTMVRTHTTPVSSIVQQSEYDIRGDSPSRDILRISISVSLIVYMLIPVGIFDEQ